MERLFKDEALNRQFVEDGYTRFRLFDDRQIEELKQYYEEVARVQQAQGAAFHTTSNSGDTDLVRKVSNHLKINYFEKELSRYLCNYKLTISNYLVKESTPDSAVSAHQDWLLVDETRYASFNGWVCLEDADYTTGNMQFIPGSHRFQQSVRVAGQDRFFDRGKKHISDYMVDVPTKAGECIVFNHAVIHASRRNRSGHKRVAVVVGGLHADADLLFYYKEKDSETIEKYRIDVDVILDMKPLQRPPRGELLGHVRPDVGYLSARELKTLCSARIGKWHVLRNKLVNLFLGRSN